MLLCLCCCAVMERDNTAAPQAGSSSQNEDIHMVEPSSSPREASPPQDVATQVQEEEETAGEGTSQKDDIMPKQAQGGVKRRVHSSDTGEGSEMTPVSEGEEMEDGHLCPICMEPWSNSGSHRLCCLRCGHLFGQSCIVRWLEVACPASHRRCPQCNKKASLREIRLLYARRLQVIDTTEQERLREELARTKEQKSRITLEMANQQLALEMYRTKYEQLKQQVEEMEANVQRQVPMTPSTVSRFVHAHSLCISRTGGCRVLAFNSWLNTLCVSQRSCNNLFSGYGIKKIEAHDFRPTQFVFLHHKPIRDLAFHPERKDVLLSASLDKTAKLLDMSSNTVMSSYVLDGPLWSCAWDAIDSNAFFVGGQNGMVSQYDLRQCSMPLCRLPSSAGDPSPVTSVVSLPESCGSGILVCQLGSCWSYRRDAGQYKGHQLQLDGPFTYMCYEGQARHVLISTRPSARSQHACHILCRLVMPGADTEDAEGSVVCEPSHTFLGGTTQKLLSRPCQMWVRGQPLVAAHMESTNSVAVWCATTKQTVSRLPTSDAIIDLCPLRVNTTDSLATLSDQTLRIYSVT